MVVCELDAEVSGEVLGWKLPPWQAILINRVLPSCGGLLVYLTLMCYDIALIYEHDRNGNNGMAVFCIILMVLPALICLVFTLASPPPGLQTEVSAFTVTLQQNDLKWILMQFLNTLFFPVAAIGRYCHQIFWWIEAVCASYVNNEGRVSEALRQAHAPSPLELYLFLQAFVHAAPHVIFNILDMMSHVATPDFDKVTVQSVSIIASTLRMASTATVYRRFEREKLCGRKYPWHVLQETVDDTRNSEKVEFINEKNDEQIYETLINYNTKNIETKHSSDMIDFSSPKNSMVKQSSIDDNNSIYSDLSSNFVPENRDLTGSPKSSVLDSDEEYMKPVSIIHRNAPRRRDTQYTIEKVYVPPPPAIDAPRPGSLAVWAEKIVENAESIPTWLSAPPRRMHQEIIKDEPDIPRRVPRPYMRGLEPQDATASLINFLGWHMFFIARLLSIAAFINFFPFVAIIVLFSHYQVMLLFLIIPQASTVKRGFYVFLAFIHLFCLMEFKIRFRHVRVWHMYWFIVCTIEIIVFTSLWAAVNNSLHEWWKQFITMVVFISMILSYICFIVYFVILKPKETLVYINIKNNPK